MLVLMNKALLATNMEKKIEKIKNFRLFLLKQIEDLTTEQLNKIPEGYNNNIIWNIGHLISAEQTMCYARTGLPFAVADKYCLPYMTGTRPETFVAASEIDHIKEIFTSSIDRLQTDFALKIFKPYSPSVMIPKVYGFEVQDIDGAIEYLLYHEGLHAGYIAALKRQL